MGMANLMSKRVDFDISKFATTELTYLTESEEFSWRADFCRKRPLFLHLQTPFDALIDAFRFAS